MLFKSVVCTAYLILSVSIGVFGDAFSVPNKSDWLVTPTYMVSILRFSSWRFLFLRVSNSILLALWMFWSYSLLRHSISWSSNKISWSRCFRITFSSSAMRRDARSTVDRSELSYYVARLCSELDVWYLIWLRILEICWTSFSSLTFIS